MTGMTMSSHRLNPATAFGIRRAHTWTVVAALLATAALVALLIVVQSGPRAQATSVPAQGLEQLDRANARAIEPIHFPGRPY
jgi:hypothetical protein